MPSLLLTEVSRDQDWWIESFLFENCVFSHHMKDGGSFHTYVTRHSDITVGTQKVIVSVTAVLNAWLPINAKTLLGVRFCSLLKI